MADLTPGQQAFIAFHSAAAGRELSPAELPDWSTIREDTIRAWDAAAQAGRDAFAKRESSQAGE